MRGITIVYYSTHTAASKQKPAVSKQKPSSLKSNSANMIAHKKLGYTRDFWSKQKPKMWIMDRALRYAMKANGKFCATTKATFIQIALAGLKSEFCHSARASLL